MISSCHEQRACKQGKGKDMQRMNRFGVQGRRLWWGAATVLLGAVFVWSAGGCDDDGDGNGGNGGGSSGGLCEDYCAATANCSGASANCVAECEAAFGQGCDNETEALFQCTIDATDPCEIVGVCDAQMAALTNCMSGTGGAGGA
jgi:hypothetical protein